MPRTLAALRRMADLRRLLERERNNAKPNAAKIERMMAEYKAIETAEHVKLVFGDRGRVQS
jgi:hypothetical protein